MPCHFIGWAAIVLVAACAEPPPSQTSAAASATRGDKSDFPVIPNLSHAPTLAVSTVPASGDVNPYGVAYVPAAFPAGGSIAAGDIVVANFNDAANAQGTGSTIVAIHPDGTQTLFFQGAPGLGLSTALGVLRAGFVIVGNVPSTDGSGVCTQSGASEQGVGSGSLIILDRAGRLVQTITTVDGPWDLTIDDRGDTAALYVSNVLDGSVARLDLVIGTQVTVAAQTRIASGYAHRCDPAAFVVGPTGLALDAATDTLYVAATADNALFAISNASTRGSAGTGETFVSDAAHLHGPVGLALAPNGDLLATQGDAVNPQQGHPSELVEYDASGDFITERTIDRAPGSAFGLAIVPLGDGFSLAAVDDGTNQLDVWNEP